MADQMQIESKMSQFIGMRVVSTTFNDHDNILTIEFDSSDDPNAPNIHTLQLFDLTGTVEEILRVD